MTRKDMEDLPPLARAKAMDRPYRPGQRRRQILVGAAVIAALLAAFLAWMPDGAPKRTSARRASDTSPGIVYPNLRVSAPQPQRETDGKTAATATP